MPDNNIISTSEFLALEQEPTTVPVQENIQDDDNISEEQFS
jgi:hypothetical protein